MSDISMSDTELLKYAIENGIIDPAHVQEKIEMQRREELLKMHPYTIWEGNDGKWHTYLPDNKGRVPKKRSSRKEIEDVVIGFWKEKLENPTVKDIYYEWVDDRLARKEISKATYDRYQVDFNKFFGNFGKIRIKEVAEIDIEDFLLNAISEYSLTARSFSNLRTLVYGIFKRAKKKHYISFSITQVTNDMEIAKNSFKKVVKEDYQEVFMEDEEPKVINYLVENQDILNLGILLLFKTGMRVGELVAVKFSDIIGNTIRIRRTETRYKDENGKAVFGIKETPKTEAGIRDVIIPNDFLWIIRKIKVLNPFGEYLLTKDGSRVKTYSIRKRLYSICEKTYIYKKSPHKIRKTYGSILMDNDIDSTLIIGQMGHTDIQCTERHYHRNRKNNDRKADILSSVPELMAR